MCVRGFVHVCVWLCGISIGVLVLVASCVWLFLLDFTILSYIINSSKVTDICSHCKIAWTHLPFKQELLDMPMNWNRAITLKSQSNFLPICTSSLHSDHCC